MSKFRLGWRKNRPGYDPPAHHLMQAVRSAAKLDPLVNASLLPFRGRRQDQFNVGSCWAFATSRAIQLYLAANEGITDFIASQRKLYWDGRIEEYAGQDLSTIPPLTDSGTEPRIGLEAARRLGIVSLTDCPYVGEPGPNNIQPAPELYETAYDARGLQYAAVGPRARRVQTIADAIKHRIPSEFGMLVDSAFMDNHGERITSINDNQIEGGHMLAPLAVLDSQLIQDFGNALRLPHDTQPGDVLFDNWWGLGDSWGTKDGYGVMAGGLFGSPWIEDVLLIQGVPLVRKVA
jgi:hypothetical protein